MSDTGFALSPTPAAKGAVDPSDVGGGGPVEFAPQLVALTDPTSESAESIRAIRTHIIAQHIQAGRRALAICSPSDGAGCTFLAANLAAALAQVGLSVLLIDGDLQEPGINKFIKPEHPSLGMIGFLSSRDGTISEYIEHDVLPNLSVLYAGPAQHNAGDLIPRERFSQIVESCLRDYDITIIDTPPANRSADARRICNVAGYALIVARRNRSLVPDVKTLCRQVAADHAIVIGTVLNA